MRLLVHNMVSSKANGYPLRVEARKCDYIRADFNPDLLRHLFPKLNWPVFVATARSVGCRVNLPDRADVAMLNSDDFLRSLHRALIEFHVLEGALVCPKSGRHFPIKKGVLYMQD